MIETISESHFHLPFMDKSVKQTIDKLKAYQNEARKERLRMWKNGDINSDNDDNEEEKASKTVGSMTYPAARCGVTALRPTFGTVGRTGVMSLSESLDKLGPLCRSAADCAIILDSIRGKDPDDISVAAVSVRNLPPSAVDDPENLDVRGFLDVNKGRTMEAIVEYVRDGSTLHVYLLPDILNPKSIFKRNSFITVIPRSFIPVLRISHPSHHPDQEIQIK
ncbi:hypothetical protein POM88_010433 [Heracleum sosnowskyi]|uniref:Amidase domain-containing protein n=1 Tax=Heracleum sosnowskyi TaxID=360622 RepID=A0AAD8IW06_9APIA|nr:hypothetical protein POM88_010433 [Heracleum sosnowskyi]